MLEISSRLLQTDLRFKSKEALLLDIRKHGRDSTRKQWMGKWGSNLEFTCGAHCSQPCTSYDSGYNIYLKITYCILQLHQHLQSISNTYLRSLGWGCGWKCKGCRKSLEEKAKNENAAGKWSRGGERMPKNKKEMFLPTRVYIWVKSRKTGHTSPVFWLFFREDTFLRYFF